MVPPHPDTLPEEEESYNLMFLVSTTWPDDTADPEALGTPPVHIAAGHPRTLLRAVADPRQPGDEDIVRDVMNNVSIATLLMSLCRDCWGTWSPGVDSKVCWFCQSHNIGSLCFRWGLSVTRVHIVGTQETVYKPAWWFLDWDQPRDQHAVPSVHNVQMCWPACVCMCHLCEKSEVGLLTWNAEKCQNCWAVHFTDLPEFVKQIKLENHKNYLLRPQMKKVRYMKFLFSMVSSKKIFMIGFKTLIQVSNFVSSHHHCLIFIKYIDTGK